MLARNRYALKEWTGLCAGLDRGDHILLVRKGGILERREGFRMEHREFFLFPTQFHEKGDVPSDRVELSLYASVEADVEVLDLDRLRRLQGRHGLPAEDVERRFHYGDRPGVHVLALRAWRLAGPLGVEKARAYDGCRSWVELASELPVQVRGPVLEEPDFRRRLDSVRAVLDG